MNRGSGRQLVGWMLALGALGALAAPVHATTPLRIIYASPDITFTTGGLTAADEDVAFDDFIADSIGLLNSPGLFPPEVAVDAAFFDDANPLPLFSLDVTTEISGTVYHPADVLTTNFATFSKVFDSVAAGVPPGVNVDAVSRDADGDLLLSFDVTVALSGVTFDDEDLALYDGQDFSLFFDGSAAGVPTALDLDGADFLKFVGKLALSFDGSGEIDGVFFDDEDVLEYDTSLRLVSSWSLAFDASESDLAWDPAADLDAVIALGLRLGDADGDGDVDAADADYLAAFFFAVGPGPIGPVDMNLDGTVDAADLLGLLALLYG